MKLAVAFVALMAPAGLAAPPGASALTGASVDYHPNPAFGLFPPAHANDAPPGAVEQVGEVVVLEGDSTIVYDDGMGNFGIVDPPIVAQRFFTRYADEFDELVIFTSFDDNGQMGASAYEVSAQQDVRGIGRAVISQQFPWVGVGKHFYAFVNMMRWDQFADWGVPITDPGSYLYSVLGQEFAHRWLSFMHYVDGSGAVSQGLLGRDRAHWASTLQADASVMDGNQLTDNQDGSFTVTDSSSRYSALDLYGMGLLGPSEVPPFFRVKDAKRQDGTAINPAHYLGRNTRFTGTREDITIQQVILAEGPRLPSAADAPHAFRVAFALVTRPGEGAGQVIDVARTLDRVRLVWEKKFGEYTGGRGTMCTQVSAPCGAPEAQVAGGKVDEAGGNQNGVAEPGEPVTVRVELTNPSIQAATAVQVSALGPVATGSSNFDLLATGATREVTFAGQVPADAACGTPITIGIASLVAGNTFRGFVQFTPGLTTGLYDDFEAGGGHFDVDAGRIDTATANGWEWGTPETYGSGIGWTFQPPAGADGGRCWFTGLAAGHKPYHDSSLGTGSSSLWSRAIDASEFYQVALDYQVWWEAIDFTDPKNPMVPSDAELAVEASLDGGRSWLRLEGVNGATPRWLPRHVALPALHGAHALVVRFTAVNPNPAYVIEAGIDDVKLTTLTPACNPDAPKAMGAPPSHASGCEVAAGAPGGGRSWFGLGLGLALLVLGARRRRSRAT